jgi:DHA2 family multidrug resistance protein-like MFS transporter
VSNQNAGRWWALAAIGVSMLTVGVDSTILNIALPIISADLQASTSDLQWVADAFILAMAALLLPAGLLGDRLGRKRFLLVALVGFGLASVWCAYSTSPGMLITARAALGICAAILIPLGTSILLVLFDEEKERTKAVAVIALAQMLGLPLGPIVGGALLNHFWWGSAFMINIPLVALGLLGVFFLVPDTPGQRNISIDPLGVVMSSAGLFGIVYGAIKAGETSWGSAEALVPLIAGSVVMVLFALWEIRATATTGALVDVKLFQSRAFVWGTILSTIVTFAMFGLMFALPLYFQEVEETDALGSGLRLLPLIGGMLVSAGVTNRVAPVAGPRLVPALGFALIAGGLFLGSTTTLSSDYLFVAVWLVIVGLGLGLALTRSMAAAINTLPKERGGVGSALVSAMRQVGGAVGVAVLGTVANSAYRSNLDLPGVPAQVDEVARKSVSTGVAVGEKLGLPSIIHAVQDAFMSAMQTLLVVCGALAAVSTVLALAFMPKRSKAVAAPEPETPPEEEKVSGLVH